MIARALALDVFAAAVSACDPGRSAAFDPGNRELVAFAVGKAALAMARSLGPVKRGLVVAPQSGEVPGGWRVMVGAHPEPDERSVEAGRAVIELVESAGRGSWLVALLSGGASALIEQPRIPIGEFRAIVRAVMHAGALIEDLNLVRGALSTIKAGQLAARSKAPIVTQAVSDVIGDDLTVIGSGPTIGPWTKTPGVPVDHGAYLDLRRRQAIPILLDLGIAIPPVFDAPIPSRFVTRTDTAMVTRPMWTFADAASRELRARGVAARLHDPPLQDRVDLVADELDAMPGLVVAWGEPTIRLPAGHGQGGRAQQLALELAKRWRDRARSALVIGSDGIDGPAPRARPTPAGAFVDGSTWGAILRAGIDPDAALERCDAGSALAAIGALVVTGPTGINHGDLVILG